jgi:FlaA1/EpsC-like NDP-sugar epimerase
MEKNHEMDHGNKGSNSYTKFALMLLSSFVAMYITMYFNTYEIDHAYFSMTRFYMACMGISAMAVIMLLFMVNMYRNTKLNSAIIIGSALLFFSALGLVRSQTPIGDVLYLKGMIPHHSIAILTSKRAAINDPVVRKLADEIIVAQESEIAEMKAHIERLQSAD